MTTLTVALCVVCFSLAQGASQLTNTKRIIGLQLAESGEGSRVTVTGDSVLDDYEAFRRGERFYVRIPAADFVTAQPRFQGPGFEDVQVQKVGDGVVISFRLHPGANARVIGAANRLEVIFTSPNHFAGNSGAPAVRNRIARNSPADRNPSNRYSRSSVDAAGPMPPDSVDSNSENNVQAAPTFPARSRNSSRPNVSRVEPVSINGSMPAASPMATTAPGATSTPFPTSSTYSSTYPPATAAYSPAPIQPAPQANGKSFDIERRSRTILQWISTNKKLSAGIGLSAVGLIGVVIFLLRRKRLNRRAMKAHATRVQPKYSPEDELGDDLNARPSIAYVEKDTYEGWDENNSADDFFFEDLTANAGTDVAYNKAEAATSFVAEADESWEYVPGSNSQAYTNKVQEEREVFEL